MAVAALFSLKRTIEGLVDSPQISPHEKIIESALEEISSLDELPWEKDEVDVTCSESFNASIGEIRDALWKFEDALETYVCLGDSERGTRIDVSRFLEETYREFKACIANLKRIWLDEASRNTSLRNDGAVPIAVPVDTRILKMVGLSNEKEIIDFLMDLPSNLKTVSFFGMAGIGKTTLATKIFENPLVLDHFDVRAFVTIGPEYQYKEIIQRMLAQMGDHADIDKMYMDEDKMDRYFERSLKGRRYLIVLDDIWRKSCWAKFQGLLPDNRNGSRVLLTSRLKTVAKRASYVYPIRFMNEEESWDLLREKVFGEDQMRPFQLEKAGRKIAKNCEGLPLAIIAVARLLSKAPNKTPEYWNKVAQMENLEFISGDDEILNILFPSYKHLPGYLKPLFLYLGAFPPKSKIPTSKLFNLWSAEGLVYSQVVIKNSLKSLVSRSVVLVHQNSSSFGAKTCGVHVVFWHLCIRETKKEKFFHVLNSYADSFIEGIENQRRLCIYKNVLFGIKDVYNSIESVSMVRSLLCTGPYHKYPLPICFRWKLLRVVNALTVRFYKFPIEVLQLVRLKYLALTYNGEVHHSISKLCNLQFLIVHRSLSIISSGARFYLPIEIWDMEKLTHLHVMGSDLLDPCGDALLPNLTTLFGVSVRSCTVRVLGRIPNLEKLGIQVELAPNDVELSSCFDHMSCVDDLQSLKCIIMNPNPMSQVVAFPTSPKNFPWYLKKLSLNGFGYPWEYARVIGQLKNLKVLKLRCYAFQGSEWEINEGEFRSLRYLLLEDTDLVHWRADCYCFPELERLIIKHCYKLKEIPSTIADIERIEMIELLDCPLAVAAVEQMQEDRESRLGLGPHSVRVLSSQDDAKLMP